jgi:hypothetical protein
MQKLILSVRSIFLEVCKKATSMSSAANKEKKGRNAKSEKTKKRETKSAMETIVAFYGALFSKAKLDKANKEFHVRQELNKNSTRTQEELKKELKKKLSIALPKFKGQTLGANVVLKALTGKFYSTTTNASRNVFYGWTVPTLISLISQTGFGNKVNVDSLGEIGGRSPASLAAEKLEYYLKTVAVLDKFPSTLDTTFMTTPTPEEATNALKKMDSKLVWNSKSSKKEGGLSAVEKEGGLSAVEKEGGLSAVEKEGGLSAVGKEALEKLISFNAGKKKMKAASVVSKVFKRNHKKEDVYQVLNATKRGNKTRMDIVGGENGKALNFEDDVMIKNTALKLIDDRTMRAILKALGKRSVTYVDVVTLQTALKLEFRQKFVMKLTEPIQPKKMTLREQYFSGPDTALIPAGTKAMQCSLLFEKKPNPKGCKESKSISDADINKAISYQIGNKMVAPDVVYVGSVAIDKIVCDGHVNVTLDNRNVCYAPIQTKVDNMLAATYTGTVFAYDNATGHEAYTGSLDSILETVIGKDLYDLIHPMERPCESLMRARCIARYQNEKAFSA